MRAVIFSLSILILFAACKSNASKVASDQDLSKGSSEEIATDAAFVDEYDGYEYFDLARYLVDEEGIPADSIAHISTTCFVQIWRPEVKTFEDEESEEAEAYFTAMDDLVYYMYESSEKMKNLGTADTAIRSRFIKFDVAGSSYLIVDTEKCEQQVNALLYKKGNKPLVIDITDGNTGREKLYLGIK